METFKHFTVDNGEKGFKVTLHKDQIEMVAENKEGKAILHTAVLDTEGNKIKLVIKNSYAHVKRTING